MIFDDVLLYYYHYYLFNDDIDDYYKVTSLASASSLVNTIRVPGAASGMAQNLAGICFPITAEIYTAGIGSKKEHFVIALLMAKKQCTGLILQ